MKWAILFELCVTHQIGRFSSQVLAVSFACSRILLPFLKGLVEELLNQVTAAFCLATIRSSMREAWRAKWVQLNRAAIHEQMNANALSNAGLA